MLARRWDVVPRAQEHPSQVRPVPTAAPASWRSHSAAPWGLLRSHVSPKSLAFLWCTRFVPFLSVLLCLMSSWYF